MAYKAFISFKNTAPGGGQTADYTIAKELHSKLNSEGMEVFFSEKDLSTAAFMDEIYQALDEAQLLILVGTSVEYITSKWVKSEWQNFIGAINSGKKPGGQILTVLGGISAKELPIQLSNLQSFDAVDIDAAVDFAFKALGMVKNSEVEQRLADEAARKAREAEEARLLEARRQMEEELRAQREHQRAERRRERELKAADAARKRRERAEQRAAQKEASARVSKAPAGGKRGVKIVAVVVCLALVVGVAVWGAGYWEKQEELKQLELQRQQEELRQEELRQEEQKRQQDEHLRSDIEFEYNKVPDGYLIHSYRGAETDVIIPETRKGLPVTVIGRLFDYPDVKPKSITSITIPNSVTSIGYGAFLGCTSLTSITIPNSVTSIGKWAFYNCTSLTSITIPDSVTSIGKWAFYNCTSLTSITIPDSVVSIDPYAFCNCTRLTSITIPDSVTSIGAWAFDGCEITITAPRKASYYGYDPDWGVAWVVKN